MKYFDVQLKVENYMGFSSMGCFDDLKDNPMELCLLMTFSNAYNLFGNLSCNIIVRIKKGKKTIKELNMYELRKKGQLDYYTRNFDGSVDSLDDYAKRQINK